MGFSLEYIEKNDDKTEFVISTVMEIAEFGTLFHILYDESIFLPWGWRLKAMVDISEGMEYLHDRLILHHDIKSLNILVTSMDSDETVAKLADFGESRIFYSYTKRDNIDNPSVIM